MTPTDRQQSLAAARRACEWLRQYTCTVVWINASLKERVTSLIEGFELLDEKEQAITAAVEAERAFFIELCEKVIKANNQVKGDGRGINLLMTDLINKIRARGGKGEG